MANKIPKIIHTCWFGSAEKPHLIKNCMESWKRILPDFEIREWNEHNFDLSQNKFAQEAFNKKRYAFVTDYVRLSVLNEFGGIYMDSDVEVIKPFKRFLVHGAFTGHETKDLMVTATMGSLPNHPWINMLLEYYSLDRPYDETTNTQIITQLSKPLVEREAYGFKYLKNDVVIYPIHTFCSYEHQKLEIIPHEDAYAYHHFAGSWTSRGVIQ